MKFISPPDEAECDSNQMAKHCKVIFFFNKKCASASDLLLFFLNPAGWLWVDALVQTVRQKQKKKKGSVWFLLPLLQVAVNKGLNVVP